MTKQKEKAHPKPVKGPVPHVGGSFRRGEDGELTRIPLPKPKIDTGDGKSPTTALAKSATKE